MQAKQEPAENYSSALSAAINTLTTTEDNGQFSASREMQDGD